MPKKTEIEKAAAPAKAPKETTPKEPVKRAQIGDRVKPRGTGFSWKEGVLVGLSSDEFVASVGETALTPDSNCVKMRRGDLIVVEAV